MMIIKTKCNNAISNKCLIDNRVIISKIIAVILILGLTGLLAAQSAFSQIKLPEPIGYVNDFANILSIKERQTLTHYMEELKEKTGAEVAVVTLNSIEPNDINLYAVKLFEKWGIGEAHKDNGVLILLTLKEREVRIEVGYGLEGTIPDGLAGEIIRQNMIPYFKQGNYGEGIVNGTFTVIYEIAKEYKVEITGLAQRAKAVKKGDGSGLGSLLGTIFIIMLFVIILGLKPGLLAFLLFGPRGGGGYWGGRGCGGFGGGFGGFGGGSSGGGGATGRW